MSSSTPHQWSIYPHTVLAFRPSKDWTKKPHESRLTRVRDKYRREGIRRTVSAVLLIHQHGHPHVIFFLHEQTQTYHLPGGCLRPGESDKDGLQRKLGKCISGAPCEVGELLGVWWRPNFEELMYPYLPAHITRPKEQQKLYQVTLTNKCTFVLPAGHTMIAVSLTDLYDGTAKYGPLHASIPSLISRFNFICLVKQDEGGHLSQQHHQQQT